MRHENATTCTHLQAIAEPNLGDIELGMKLPQANAVHAE
jgi:hypothetical protein